jgi:hypothetical protein
MKPEVVDNKTVFNVGVAFIGKRAPASYEAEPWTRYDINTAAFQALSRAEEILIPLSDQRVHTRYNIAVDMRLDLVDPNGEVTDSEHTVTENISAKGATIFTTLQIPEGRFIRLTSDQYRVTAHAAIRSRSTGADGVPRIHVEFVDREWPL